MSMKIETPSWAKEGPNDLEYRMYKMLGHANSLRKRLEDQELMGVLFEVDSTLDYLYQYDAIRLTTEEEMAFSAIQMGPLSSFFSIETFESSAEPSPMMDQLVNKAIDVFEELHSDCRAKWQLIEKSLRVSYVGDKSYFLSDGFVFLKTASNELQIFYFNKPIKNFTTTWKDFNLQHIKTQEWDQEDYFESLEEIVSKKSNKIILRAELDIDVAIDKNALVVLNCLVFTRLRRDYAF